VIAYKVHRTTLEDTLLFSCQRPDQLPGQAFAFRPGSPKLF
jgi:hypothetical protein